MCLQCHCCHASCQAPAYLADVLVGVGAEFGIVAVGGVGAGNVLAAVAELCVAQVAQVPAAAAAVAGSAPECRAADCTVSETCLAWPPDSYDMWSKVALPMPARLVVGSRSATVVGLGLRGEPQCAQGCCARPGGVGLEVLQEVPAEVA
jgi:hypothetical protein